MAEVLDIRNRVSDEQLESVSRGGNCLWLLQSRLVMRDLRSRYPAFSFGDVHGILYKGTVLALGSDRADAFLYDAGRPEKVTRQYEERRKHCAKELRVQIKKLQRELSSLENNRG